MLNSGFNSNEWICFTKILEVHEKITAKDYGRLQDFYNICHGKKVVFPFDIKKKQIPLPVKHTKKTYTVREKKTYKSCDSLGDRLSKLSVLAGSSCNVPICNLLDTNATP